MVIPRAVSDRFLIRKCNEGQLSDDERAEYEIVCFDGASKVAEGRMVSAVESMTFENFHRLSIRFRLGATNETRFVSHG